MALDDLEKFDGLLVDWIRIHVQTNPFNSFLALIYILQTITIIIFFNTTAYETPDVWTYISSNKTSTIGYAIHLHPFSSHISL